MIEICIENSACFIYDIKDWEILRSKHKIIGVTLGNNFCIPSLPLQLLPEEAVTLKRKGLGRFVHYPKLTASPSNPDYQLFNEFKQELIEQLKLIYKRIRDPVLYHAVNIVRCVSVGDNFHPSELIAFSRLGTSVKKRTILATLKDNGIVSYITLNWLDT